jgi:REP element-mobilizing transposase RayT
MPRQARLDAPSTLHHVMIRGIERRKIVNNDMDRKDFVSRMGKIASETQTSIYAWSLMANHAHILLRSGPSGLPRFMRRLLTGYAINYNLRHRRHGHLFQNRYKSIVCEEDTYFIELVRYIHLNPLRAKLVDSFAKLDRYRWCGHSVLMGRAKNDWQQRDYVLRWFGKKQGEAKRAYRHYVKEGIDQGRRPELVGGGLIRSHGGWSAVNAMRRLGIRKKADNRILGSGEFVEQLIKQADESVKYQFYGPEHLKGVVRLIEKVCKKENVSYKALKSGSRRKNVSQIRSQLIKKLVEDYGLSFAETARHLGVSTSAIANSLRRRRKKCK